MSTSLAEAAAKKAAREAAERAAEAAAKTAAEAAAKAAASASQSAVKAAADAAVAAAKAAKEAAAKAADEAAALAKEAAKTGATPATKKAAEEAADKAAKLSKLANEASDAAKSAKKTAKGSKAAAKGSKATAKNAAAVLAAGGALAGGILWIDNELKKADEKIKDCMKVCLPDNWDDYIYGENVKKSELKYKDIEEDLGDQPLCTKTIQDCGEFCEKKCTEIHGKDLPGSNVIERVRQNTTDFFDNLNPFKGMGDVIGKVMFGFGIFIAIVIFIMIGYFVFKAVVNKKS